MHGWSLTEWLTYPWFHFNCSLPRQSLLLSILRHQCVHSLATITATCCNIRRYNCICDSAPIGILSATDPEHAWLRHSSNIMLSTHFSYGQSPLDKWSMYQNIQVGEFVERSLTWHDMSTGHNVILIYTTYILTSLTIDVLQSTVNSL